MRSQMSSTRSSAKVFFKSTATSSAWGDTTEEPQTAIEMLSPDSTQPSSSRRSDVRISTPLREQQQQETSHSSSHNSRSVRSIIEEQINETCCCFCGSVFVSIILAGSCMVGAGLLLDSVQKWEVYRKIPALISMVAALIGLKGDLEMTLASKLATHANRHPNHVAKKNILNFYYIVGNLSMIQIKAVMVTSLWVIPVVIYHCTVKKEQFNVHYNGILLASSLASVSVASLLLCIVMIGIVVVVPIFGCNPDNITIPTAGALGDLATLAFLSFFADTFFHVWPWLNLIVILSILAALPLWILFASWDESAWKTLRTGWLPLAFSMILSGIAGFVLQFALGLYPSIALFQPVLNGVCGNLAAVHASRISTKFHNDDAITLGVVPKGWEVLKRLNPCEAFCSVDWDVRVLLCLVVPAHLIFNLVISVLNPSDESIRTVAFLLSYSVTALIQVAVLLYIAQLLVAVTWKLSMDPDANVIPYLTAIADLLGTALLLGTFFFLDKTFQRMEPGETSTTITTPSHR